MQVCDIDFCYAFLFVCLHNSLCILSQALENKYTCEILVHSVLNKVINNVLFFGFFPHVMKSVVCILSLLVL